MSLTNLLTNCDRSKQYTRKFVLYKNHKAID